MDDNNPDYNNKAAHGYSSNLLKVRGISKSFNSSGTCLEILKEIDFDLDKGETISIVGASGIG
ncbi:MAG: hypothetical protein Q8M56_14995, partial [Desulfobacterales bacterium]|nr:hypothetical protein [Desulfobacterales bacterium]